MTSNVCEIRDPETDREILKRLVKAANIKKRWAGMSTEELLENRRRENAKNRIPELKDDAFVTSRIEVMGCPVLKLIHRKKTDRANLFLIGGGMISAPRPGSVKKALRFAKETDDGHGDTPLPGYIMAISPGTCVETEEEWRRMLELDKKDVAIPATYMKTAVVIMRHEDDSVPDYMLWLQRGDFTNCPKVTFIYGSDETLYACAPSFEAAMKKYGVEYEMIVGEGMFHCYPVFPICKEAKEGWDLMIQKMKENAK